MWCVHGRTVAMPSTTNGWNVASQFPVWVNVAQGHLTVWSSQIDRSIPGRSGPQASQHCREWFVRLVHFSIASVFVKIEFIGKIVDDQIYSTVIVNDEQ
jgi:hypothetical protein